MNSTRTLKVIIVALLISLGYSLYYIDNLKIDRNTSVSESEEILCIDFSDKKPSTLKIGLVGDMINTYQTNQLKSMGYNETRAVVFNLDTIQKVIYDIKNELRKNSINPNEEVLGLRLYYAAYPDSLKFDKPGYEELNGIPKHYEKRLTAVFLPTKVNSSGKIIDFNPADTTTYNTGIPEYVHDPYSPIFNRKIISITGSPDHETKTMSRNHGQITPPFDNNSTLSF